MEFYPSSKHAAGSKTETAPSENYKRKEIELSNDKIAPLIGRSGRNISLLQLKLNLKIIIPESSKLISNEESASGSSEKVVVTLVAEGVYDFEFVEANKPWQNQVQRYLKSATRGGFLKYMNQEEIDQIGTFGMDKMIQKFREVETAYKVTVEKVQIFPGEFCWIVLEEPGCGKGKLETAIEIVGGVFHNRHQNKNSRGKGRG